MATSDTAPGFNVRHYFRILKRRRLIVAVTAAVIVALAVGISLTETPKYSASAQIVCAPTSSGLTGTANSVSFDPAQDVQTQIAVMTSEPVRKEVAKALGVATAPRVSATAILNTNAIQISATSTDPVLAERRANAYATAYIDFRKSRTVNNLLDAEQLIHLR